jgi:hypothetical protein
MDGAATYRARQRDTRCRDGVPALVARTQRLPNDN